MPVPAPDYELGQFFDLSPDLLCIAGFDGYFKRLNPSFERVLGYSSEELMSRPFLEFVHPDDVERARDAFSRLATGEDIVGFEGRLVCSDGSVRQFEWNTRTLPHEGVLYGIARDVTVRGALAEEQAALRRVAVLVAQQPSPSEVFTAVTQAVGLLLDADLAVLHVFPGRRHSEDDRQLERRRAHAADRDTVSTGWRQPRRPHLRDRRAGANAQLRRGVGA